MKSVDQYRGNLVGGPRWADAGPDVDKLQKIADDKRKKLEKAKAEYEAAINKPGATFTGTQSFHNAMTRAEYELERAESNLEIEKAKSK